MFPIYTLMAANYSAEMSIAMPAVSFAVLGVVFGIGGGTLGGRMIENVPDSERAGASSILSFIMYFSSALGTALFFGLFNLGSGEGEQGLDVGPGTSSVPGRVPVRDARGHRAGCDRPGADAGPEGRSEKGHGGLPKRIHVTRTRPATVPIGTRLRSGAGVDLSRP